MDYGYSSRAWYLEAQDKLQRFLPLQRWVWHHGKGLLQVQCSTSFGDGRYAVSA